MNPSIQAPAGSTRKYPLNKWAIASLVTLLAGVLLLLLIGLIYATVIITANPVTGDQAGWNVLAFVILPVGLVQRYIVLFALTSLVLAIISLVKSKGQRNILAITMTVITALMSLQLPNFLAITFGIGR